MCVCVCLSALQVASYKSQDNFPDFSALPLPSHPPQMESLFGSLPEMLDFQRVFLQTLEERIASSPDFSTLQTPSQFKVSPRPPTTGIDSQRGTVGSRSSQRTPAGFFSSFLPF